MFRFSTFSLPAALARLLLAILFLAMCLPAAAQAPAWQSARAVAVATAGATTNFSAVTATAIDASGNVFLAGMFSNTVVLDGITLTSLGGSDVFVAKFNPASNQFVWAQRAGSIDFDQATALAVNGTSVYVAGYFGGSTASFGSTTLTNAGSTDGFVAKLADAGSTGSFAWAQRAGSIYSDRAYALAVSGTSVYMAGSFGSAPASFGALTLTSAGATDGFVAKLTDAGSTGNFVWVQQVGGSMFDEAFALAVSGTNVYVAGYFGSPTVGLGTVTLTNVGGNAGSADVFVTKLMDAGSTSSFVWAQRAGGLGFDVAYALAVNGTSIYITGDFSGSTSGFGATILANASGAANATDMFVAKLTDAGSTSSIVWAQRAGGTGSEGATALAVSGTSVYVAGYFASPTASFGSTTLTNIASTNSQDVYMAKLTDAGSMGSFVWAQRAGGVGNEYAYALTVSGTSVFMTGFFSSAAVNFGAISLTNPTSNTSLAFLASLTDPTLTASASSRTLAPAQLFPNPAHGTATLRLPAGTAPAPLTLTDALGRPLRRYPAPISPEITLDLRSLPAGFYLLRGAGPAQRLVVE